MSERDDFLRCIWCKKWKHEHTAWPARADYFKCPREAAPFVGCVFEAEKVMEIFPLSHERSRGSGVR